MRFADVLEDAIARNEAGTPFADAVAAFEQSIARAHATPAAPAWARALGVSLPCSEKALRAAFRRRAFETHPDRGGSVEAFLAVRRALEEGLAALGFGPPCSGRQDRVRPAAGSGGSVA